MIIEPDKHYNDAGLYVWTPERSISAWERCYEELRTALASGTYRKVVALIGIPGSGKSTFARAHDAADVILFDGFFASPERRRRILDISAEFGVPVEAVWLAADWETCVRRNEQRRPDRRVPQETMETMWRMLRETPPSLEEGFVAIREATTTGPG
jgi:predicted kinase